MEILIEIFFTQALSLKPTSLVAYLKDRSWDLYYYLRAQILSMMSLTDTISASIYRWRCPELYTSNLTWLNSTDCCNYAESSKCVHDVRVWVVDNRLILLVDNRLILSTNKCSLVIMDFWPTKWLYGAYWLTATLCVHVFVRACGRACVRACVHICVFSNTR